MTQEKLARRLGAIGIWMLAVNGMVGAGIFGVPARVHGHLGDYGPLAFLVCGLLLLPVVLSLAEVASHFDRTGGPVLYATTVFGPMVGFQTGWAYYVTRITAFAANANLLATVVGSIAPTAGSVTARVIILTVVIGGLTLVNVLGSQHAMRSVGVLTVLKFLPLAVLAAAGITHIATHVTAVSATAPPTFGNIGPAALLVIYSFVGFENVLVPAGEAQQPKRDIPRALILALLVVTVLYALVQLTTISLLRDPSQHDEPLIDAGRVLLGPLGASFVLFGVIASVAGNLAATMFALPRVTYSMARQGTLPRSFGHVHETRRTPIVSVLCFGSLALALALLGNFEVLAAMSTVVRLLLYLICIATLPGLRRRAPPAPSDPPQNLRLPGGLTVPILGALFCVALLSQISLRGMIATAAFVAVGFVIYALRPRAPIE